MSSNDKFYDEVRNSRNFTGKVVLVTGSGAGIGASIVKLYSALGANVVITSRSEDALHKVAVDAQQLSPKKLKPLEVIADLTKSDDLNNLLNKTIETFGKLDILVNNAGGLHATLITHPKFTDRLKSTETLDINATLELTQLAIPYLEKTNGNIIMITANLIERPLRGYLNYIIGKSALDQATKVLSIELGSKGIRVNSVSPGGIESHPGTYDQTFLDILEKTAKRTPLARVGQPQDIASAVVFLSSSDARFITGHSLVVDGGLKYNMDSNFLEDYGLD
ncbi:3-oxoacyl-[acyl-carrier-protein] reductase FabG-like [Oppia nitens]|uniref:3-oxoacyl-[acyl-carrier-protein] reductase FabG-like n=1 Tax=Oppia nitens TaxID=1686743 RepID=UPI0023DC78CE|nr:3-oxoacyl-[acyl-carrier-protein] reductase FabG-like [Oppia nitens]XP_054161174.1 3-oxoacyl-[acyl-carrier-protein] reductase FabG-like [Oppia nitens]